MTNATNVQPAAESIALPPAAAAVGNYVGWAISGNLVFISGQLPLDNGAIAVKGQLGRDLEIEDGYRAGRLCGLNILAHLKEACGGDLGRVVRVVRLGGFVCAAPEFIDAPKCVNGASDLMVEYFGAAGSHARFAVGVASLPGGAAVEVDATIEIRPAD
ncbi:MAG: RidA family protein [Azoarcus sp.]|nr:RidA family protein [Azoarcus sp.]